MDDITPTYDKKYFTFTSLEREIQPGETINDLEAYDESRRRKELLRCSNDFAYFCNKYVKISHPVKGLIPLVLYNHQRRAMQHALTHRFAALIKPRQMGVTVLFQAWALWRGLFRYGESIMVLHAYDRMALKATYVLKVMVDHLPSWMKPTMDRHNQHEAHFTDSDMRVWNYTWEACCGRAIDWLILDEACIHRNLESSWVSVLPTIATGGRCIASSSISPNSPGWTWWEKVITGNLKNDHFFDKPAKFPFGVMEMSYRDHPEYDNEAWATKIESQLGPKTFRTEVLCQRPEKKAAKNVTVDEKGHIHIHVHHHYEKSPTDFSF